MRISLNMKIAAVTAAVVMFGWIGSASAGNYVLLGSWHQQRGTAGIPLGGGGNIPAMTSATADQTGTSPATLTMPPKKFIRNALAPLVLGLPTNATVVQVLTDLNFAGPLTSPPIGSRKIKAGGPVGTPRPNPAFAFCPGTAGVSTACPSVNGGVAGGGWNGRVTYTPGHNQFSGVMQMGIAGSGVVTNEMPVASYPPKGAGCPLRDHGGACPAVVNRPFGGAGGPQAPGGRFATNNVNHLSTSLIHQVTKTGSCPITFLKGCVIGFTPTGLGAGPASTNENVGFPWTTGIVKASATKGPTPAQEDTTFTSTGKDHRTPMGSGALTLVAGGVTLRGSGAVYPSMDKITMALVPSGGAVGTPSMAPVGIAAFMGLLALAGGYTLRRNKRQD